MSQEPPIKLYLLITAVVILVLTIVGLFVRNYISEKLASSSPNEAKTAVKYHEPEEVQQSKAIISFAGILFVILIIIFLTYKLTSKYAKN